MNAAIVQRLMWKEYRFLRSFWLAALVLAGCAAIAWRGLASWYERPVQLEDFFVIAAVVTSLFALGVGGTAFATEHEVGTAEFLRRLPLDGRNLVAGKLLLSAIGLIGLKLVLWTVAGVFAIWLPVSAERMREIGWCSVVSELELLGWGMLFSLATRQPLMAITWGMIAETAVVHLVPALSRTENAHPQSFLLHDYSFALPGRAVFALALLASVAWLSTTWIRSPQPLSVVPDWLSRLTTGRRTASSRWLSGTAAMPSPVTAKGQLARLIWLQWRQSRLLWASLFVPFVASGLWVVMTHHSPSHSENIALLFAASTNLLWLGLGISVFHGQQAHFRFRYFAEHGIAPARVWWGHQLAALTPLAVSVSLFIVGIAVANPLSTWTLGMVIDMGCALLIGASLVFSIGQLVGMLARQILVAGAMGLIGLLMHFGWMLLLQEVGTPPFWVILGLIFGFGPLVLAWFWATRQHVSSWILERRTWRTRRRLVLCLVVPWTVMAMGLMVFRAIEIPNIGIEPPTREQLQSLSDEERQTADLYKSIIHSLGIDVAELIDSYARRQSHDEHEKQMLEIDQRLQQSPEILTNLLAATRRPIGAFAGDPQQQNAEASLILRVLHRAELLASERQDIDQSVALHAAMRRALLHWRQNTNFEGLKHATFLDNGQTGRLMHELRADHWSPGQLRELADRIAESSDTTWRKGRRAWEREFREAFDVLRGGNWPTHFSVKAQNDWEHSRWMLWIPGERPRACRLLNVFNSIHTQNLGNRLNLEVWQMPQRCRWNTPCANLLMYEIEKQAQTNWHDMSLSGRWQAIQVWLQMRAAKEELGRWPEAFDGLNGLGTVKATPTPFTYVGNWEGWIEYLPTGLIGERVPEPFTVRGLDHLPFEINGAEPCLVLFQFGRDRTVQLEKVRQSTNSEAREESLRGLRVEPLDPVPSAVGKKPPGY